MRRADTVTTSPNFAAKWLVHRLGDFAASRPGIDLRISASLHHVDFSREGVDIAIRRGEGRWPGLHVTRLADEELSPVCSPRLVRGGTACTGRRISRDILSCISMTGASGRHGSRRPGSP